MKQTREGAFRVPAAGVLADLRDRLNEYVVDGCEKCTQFYAEDLDELTHAVAEFLSERGVDLESL